MQKYGQWNKVNRQQVKINVYVRCFASVVEDNINFCDTYLSLQWPLLFMHFFIPVCH